MAPSGRAVVSGSLDRGRRSERTFAQRLIDWADPAATPDGAARLARRQAIERAVACATAALAGVPGLSVVFADDPGAAARAAAPARADEPATLRPLPAGAGPAALAALRGAGDRAGLVRRFSDRDLHRRLVAGLPPRAVPLADALEAARCLALGVRAFPGVRANAAARTAQRLAELGLDGAARAGDLPAVEAVSAVVEADLAGVAVAGPGEGVRKSWRRRLAAEAGYDPTALGAALADQAGFFEAARPVIEALADRLPPPPAAAPRPEPAPDGAAPDAAGPTGDPAGDPAGAARQASDARGGAAAETGAPSYRVFSTAGDRVVAIEDLVAPERLADLRATLDREAAEHRAAVARAGHRLLRTLSARRAATWRFDQEEGLIDAGRLARLVAAPGESRVYKVERAAPSLDTAVTLLMDNSGSMRGRPVLLATVAVDVLCRLLDRCGVAVEVLGFTTRDFAGGRAYAAWRRAGRPARPGRLCDLVHIVYKPADRPYRRARLALAGALDPAILKENVDGEAVAWAARRLAGRPESRRILFVVSDGAPSDRTTLRHNPPDLLDRHLASVVRGLAGGGPAGGPVEVVGIGIGHDVSAFYDEAVRVADAGVLGRALCDDLADRLAG